MRVVPAPGLQFRDPRTHRLVDPELGVEVDAADPMFGKCVLQGDLVVLSEADYAARQADRDTADRAAVAALLKDAAGEPAAADPPPAKPPAAKAPPAPPADAPKPEGAV